jgi:hypothetical protein
MLETNPALEPYLAARQDRMDTIRLTAEFSVFADIAAIALRGGTAISAQQVILGDAAFVRPALLGVFLRQALEQAWLLRAGVASDEAEIAAARAAAMFSSGEQDILTEADRAALPRWVKPMGSEIAPSAAALAKLWPAASAKTIARVRDCWSLLGTVEALMETGGDIRLARDPRSALNGYGASHRPRPWAITFASSTASSSSARGYIAADATRLRATVAMLGGERRAAVWAALDEVRDHLAATYGVPAAGAVVLAASGTDTELLALALSHLTATPAPICTILIAPEETGSGVPMAARGLHFAADTARGHDVACAAPIAGFRADTILETISLRRPDGAVRPADAVAADIERMVAAGITAGRRVVLHALDLSKTGLLGPGLGVLKRLRKRHGAKNFDIVVDACQARLSPDSVRAYLALDAVVLLTGSKFFTGPPFAGALLLSPAIAARLQSQALPVGLEAYFGRDEFPADCPAADALPPAGNYGLALRWHAAMAEMRALFSVPIERRAAILRGFGAVVADEIAANPALALLSAPAIDRRGDAEDWELCRSIYTFSLALPDAPRCLPPEEARAVYVWLNADLSGVLPDLDAEDRRLAASICHIGQPVKLPRLDGGCIGVLRVSAGARLISGEPSHRDLAGDARLQREFNDLRTVFGKIRLILQHFAVLAAANPTPRYR